MKEVSDHGGWCQCRPCLKTTNSFDGNASTEVFLVRCFKDKSEHGPTDAAKNSCVFSLTKAILIVRFLFLVL